MTLKSVPHCQICGEPAHHYLESYNPDIDKFIVMPLCDEHIQKMNITIAVLVKNAREKGASV